MKSLALFQAIIVWLILSVWTAARTRSLSVDRQHTTCTQNDRTSGHDERELATYSTLPLLSRCSSLRVYGHFDQQVGSNSVISPCVCLNLGTSGDAASFS